MKSFPILLSFLFSSTLAAAPPITVRALKINVDDMEKAIAFYRDKLEFQLAEAGKGQPRAVLKLDDQVTVVLNPVKKVRRASEDDTALSFTLQVNDLDEAINRLKASGVPFAESERRTEGVGFAISIRDPFGRRISLMHQTIRKVEPFTEPRLYNFGYRVPDMQAARDFYSGTLGFVALTERYLPRDLPLRDTAGNFAFMLHVRPNVSSLRDVDRNQSPLNVVVYQTPDLRLAESSLRTAGVKILTSRPLRGPEGPYIVFADPFGNISELVEATTR